MLSVYLQILSFGAGFDTSFFRISDLQESKNVIYYEIDLPEVVKKKAAIIRDCHELRSKLKNEKGKLSKYLLFFINMFYDY